MSNGTIANRYAQALFQTAQTKGNLERVREDLRQLNDVYQHSDDVRSFFQNPLLSHEVLVKVITGSFEGKVDATLLEFLKFLAKRGRLNLFSFIAISFEDIWNTFKGQTKVIIQTAEALDQATQDMVLNKLKSITHKDILPEWQVDASMIGGIRVYAEGRLYEHSFKNEFQDFKRKALERV